VWKGVGCFDFVLLWGHDTAQFGEIHNSLLEFWTLQYSSRDGHAEGGHINRGIDTPSFCPTLQVHDMSTLGDAEDVNHIINCHTRCNIWRSITANAYTIICRSCGKSHGTGGCVHTARCCNVCGRNLITGLISAASPRVDISSICKVGQKIGMSLPLLTCSPLAWPFLLLYRRGRKSWRDLWINLYCREDTRFRHVFSIPFSHFMKARQFWGWFENMSRNVVSSLQYSLAS
jgi:hypothetical protein